MRKQALQHTSDKRKFLIGWGIYLAASITLLAINFLILPSLSSKAQLKPLALPILQTLLLYSALFLALVALIKIVNARLFNNEAKRTTQDKADTAQTGASMSDDQVD